MSMTPTVADGRTRTRAPSNLGRALSAHAPVRNPGLRALARSIQEIDPGTERLTIEKRCGRKVATSTATRLASAPLRLRAQLLQVLGAVDRSVDTVIRRPHPPAPLLHDLHRDMRRLVGGLGVWTQVLPKRDATKLQLLIPRARRLSRLVGRVRDKDVTIALFSRYTQETDDAEEAARVLRFLMRLRDDARTGRELLRAFLRTERERGLFAEIGAFRRPPAGPWPLRPTAPAPRGGGSDPSRSGHQGPREGTEASESRAAPPPPHPGPTAPPLCRARRGSGS